MTSYEVILSYYSMELILKLKEKAKALKIEVIAIYLSMRDSRTPLLAKIMIFITISYTFSPIDLIPDFIPVLGYLDDLIILPLLIAISIRLIPGEVLEECRTKARQNIQVNKNAGIFATIIILLLWILILVALITKLT